MGQAGSCPGESRVREARTRPVRAGHMGAHSVQAEGRFEAGVYSLVDAPLIPAPAHMGSCLHERPFFLWQRVPAQRRVC